MEWNEECSDKLGMLYEFGGAWLHTRHIFNGVVGTV
jgi:hypothetical protein